MAWFGRCSAWLAFGLIVAGGGPGTALAADAPYAFERTPGHLPKTVVPLNYAIELRPDLDNALLSGSEIVDIDVRAATERLVLNAANMTLAEAALAEDPGERASIALDATAETATLSFPHALAIGRHRLRLAFSAPINHFGPGLFAVDYPTETGRKQMLATHLEPIGARRVFPCWDEPAFKASFETAVIVPERLLAVANMPVASETPAGPGLKRIVFAPTPKMSTYLFVLAAGELEKVSAQSDGIAISVVTTAGKSAEGRYALESAVRLMAYYNDYFGIKYPLPKLDLIAVPGGIGGAMENWGGIVFFESTLLFDPANTSESAKRHIFGIIAHEMAHLWFGDLVTMAWWDDLWLNEGFATWLQAKASDALNPDWHVWLTVGGATEAAMREDGRRTAHAIEQPIADDREAASVFDAITYNKGRALLRQIEAYVGEDVFRAGIRGYLRDHAYDNATTADLWQALQGGTDKPIAAVARSFTRQAGVPLIRAELRCNGERQILVLRQDRLVANDRAGHPERWSVPIALGPATAAQPTETLLLSDRAAESALGRCGETLKLNIGAIGYYRVRYDDESAAALAAMLERMTPADRVNLIADSWALVEAGDEPPARFLAFIDSAAGDDNLAVWDEMLRALERLDALERGRAGRAALRAKARLWARPAFDRLGWDAAPAEEPDRALLRVRLIRFLGDIGDDAILEEARRRFAGFRKDPALLDPRLRDVVVHLAGRIADRPTWDTLLALARGTTSTEERVRYYVALAGALDPDLAQQALGLVLGERLPPNIAGRLVFAVAYSGEHPDLAWAFVQENYAALAAQQGPRFPDRFAADVLRSFNDRAHAAELAAFAPAHATPAGRIEAARAEEGIVMDADFIERQLPAVEAWLATSAQPR
jgi:aminopeptidase N